MSQATNATTADFATQTGLLPLRSLQLIGVAGSEDDRRALLRSSAGEIWQVRVGDSVGRRTVVAMDTEAVILSRNGASETLQMPGLPRVAA